MKAYCERCDATVDASHRHPTTRKLGWVYVSLLIPIIPILPMAASDYVVSLPLFMGYLLGFGHVLAVLREPAVCDECGAYIPKPGTPRPVSAAVPSNPYRG
ncbi:MAG: hypothetical protein AAF799_03560 [Myxococcota bacterium]